MSDGALDPATSRHWRTDTPEPPPCYLARAAPLRTLARAAERPLTLVSAPAGWGKTTLLASLARHRPVLWMAAPQWAATDATRVLRATARRLGRHGPPVTIVLDDTHVWTDPRPWTAMEELLVRCSPRVRLLVGCRQDPVLPGRHRPVRIGAARLAFTYDETVDFLAAHDVRTDRSTVVSLNSILRGWPAALRLAAMAMRDRPSDCADILRPGRDRTVVDYVHGEVLDRLPCAVRDLAMHVSVLDGFTVDSVEALAGGDGAYQVDMLRRHGLVHETDHARPVSHRLHPLVARACYQALRHRQPEQVRRLHGRMAAWYGERGEAGAALHHALAAREWDAATSLVEHHWPALVAGIRGHAGPAAPPPVPPARVRRDARLALAFALERLDAGDRHASAGFMLLAGRNTPPDGESGPHRCLLATARLVRSQLADDLGGVLAASSDVMVAAVQDGPTGVDRIRLRAMTLAAVGGAHLRSGRPGRAGPALRDALALACRHDLVPVQLAALRWLAAAHLADGRLVEAARTAARAVAVGDRHSLIWQRDAMWASLILADVRCTQHRLDAARHALARAFAYDSPEPAFAAARTVVHARLRHATGVRDEPAASLAWVRRQFGPDELSVVARSAVELTEAELRLAAGENGLARSLLARRPPEPYAAWHAVVTATLRLAENRPGCAMADLRPYLAPDALPTTVAVPAGLAHARALAASGDGRAAAASIERAVRLAAPEDLREPFVAAAAMAHGLLSARLATVGTRVGFARSLLAHTIAGDGTDPLSGREAVVMRFLQSQLSVAEIAAALHVSTNTVKSHVRNLYRKLGVHHRRELQPART